VENNRGSEGPSYGALRAGLGPRPGAPRQPLSRARAAVLDTLRGQPEPTTLHALVAATGLHQNTVREHLDALVRRRLVRRRRGLPTGRRGRPAWVYEATGDEQADRSEYAGLAAALAASIHHTSASPREDAVAAGVRWGHQLARDAAHAGSDSSSDDAGPGDARRQVVDLLEDIGFAPEADAGRSVVRLTRCPLLEAAHQYPDVVCGVHLGLVRGALEEYGADPAGTDLLPFAEPGACRLHLMRGSK